ncbi:MAG: SEC-C metal-binding domain-containing protein [Candidatus Sulfotelmatobacter sp.]
MLIPAADAPRRNMPCSCGSGKKFKKCCMGKDGGNEFSSVAVPKPAGPKPKTLAARASVPAPESLETD